MDGQIKDFSAETQNMEEEVVTLGSSEMASMTVECTVDANATTAEASVRNGELSFIPNASPDSAPSAAASADLQFPTAMPWE